MKQFLSKISLLAIIFISCNKEKIDIELQTYVDDFFFEADKRNMNLSRKNLTVVFNENINSCGIGYSDFEGKGKRRVEINMSFSCWQVLSDIQKEILIFHELGHAILERGHKNEKLPNGMFTSLMAEGDILNGLYTEFSLELRDYYIDELFNSNEQIPEWAGLKTIDSVIFTEDFETSKEGWNFVVLPEELKDNVIGEIKLNSEGSSKVANILSIPNMSINGLYGWHFTFQPPELGIGGILQLRAKIKKKNFDNRNRVDLVILTESWTIDSNNNSTIISSPNEKSIIENNAEYLYTTQIGYYPNSVKEIQIQLNMTGQHNGEVEFDNVELIYIE